MSVGAIYHRVFKQEKFEKAAADIFKLVRAAQEKFPNGPRHLYLDIDGHKNRKGGFDEDMYELQRHFILGFLFPFLTEVHCPLYDVKNPNTQRNDLPDELDIYSEQEVKVMPHAKREELAKAAENLGSSEQANHLRNVNSTELN